MSDQTTTEKLTQCYGGCGQVIPYLTNRKVCCTPCRETRRRESMRLVSERMRRKNGVAVVKGTEFTCERCGCVATRNGVKRKFCELCAPERILERARARSKAKAAQGYEYQTQWLTNKCRTDPKYAINRRIRVAVRRGLIAGKGGRKWESLVGYTISDLMTHLERQFAKGMTWDNRSEWHIDHIQPLASFKFDSPEDSEFRAAWALTNLRPIWAEENLRKNVTRTHLL